MPQQVKTLRGAVIALLVLTLSDYVAAWIAPGIELDGSGSALLVALVIAVIGAILPPAVAALPLPYTFPLGFVLVLVLDAASLVIAADVLPDHISVASFWAALLASVLLAACSLVISMLIGVDEQAVSLRVLRRVARRQGVIA